MALGIYLYMREIAELRFCPPINFDGGGSLDAKRCIALYAPKILIKLLLAPTLKNIFKRTLSDSLYAPRKFQCIDFHHGI